MFLLFSNKCVGTTCFPLHVSVPPFDFIFFKAQLEDVPSGQICGARTTEGGGNQTYMKFKI